MVYTEACRKLIHAGPRNDSQICCFFSIFARIFLRTHFFVDFRSILLKITKKTMTFVNTLEKQGFRAAQQAIKIFVFVDELRRGRNFLEIYENQKFQGAICQCLLVFSAAEGGRIFLHLLASDCVFFSEADPKFFLPLVDNDKRVLVLGTPCSN